MGSRVVFFPAIQNLDTSVGCCDLYVCTRGVLARFCQYVIAVFFRWVWPITWNEFLGNISADPNVIPA